MTTLHHLLEQNVLVPMALLLTLIIHDVLVSAKIKYWCYIDINCPVLIQISMNVRILLLLSIAHKIVSTHLVVMSVPVMMATKQPVLMIAFNA